METALLGLAIVLVATLAPTYAQPKYPGTTLTLAIHAGHFAIPWQQRAATIKERFGIDIKVVGIDVGDLYKKQLLELTSGTGAFDILQYNPAWLGDYAPYLQPMDELMKKFPVDFDDILEGFRKWHSTWGGKVYGLVMDGDVLLMYYRKDLFDDPSNKTAFRRQFGYDLTPPQTWQQIRDVAKFFRNPQKNFYGYADQLKRGRSFYWYLLRYFAYCGPDAQLFDPGTMKPRINDPCAVQALTDMKELVSLQPPGVLNWEWDELFNAFMKGRIAMSIHWPDEGKRAPELEQAVKGAKMGFALVPGVKKGDRIVRRSTAAGGWLLGIAKASKNVEAAWQVVRFYESRDESLKLVTDPQTGQDLFRASHFAAPQVQQAWPKDYLRVYKETIAIMYPELRIPASFEYTDILDRQIQLVFTGQLSPKAGLDGVASEWEKLTSKRGRDKQLAAYRAAMGLK
jgi:multiple sugar transport system substrate-binding protein